MARAYKYTHTVPRRAYSTGGDIQKKRDLDKETRLQVHVTEPSTQCVKLENRFNYRTYHIGAFKRVVCPFGRGRTEGGQGGPASTCSATLLPVTRTSIHTNRSCSLGYA